MERVTHNYVKNQLKRLDTLFEVCPESRPYCVKLNHIFKDTYNQINELNTQIISFEKELEKTSIDTLKKRVTNELEINQKYDALIETNQIKLKQIKTDIQNREKMSTDDINKQLHTLFTKQREFNRSITADMRRLIMENNDKDKQLNNEYQIQKNEYLSKINRLYDQQTSNLYRINLNYHDALKSIHQRNTTRLQKTKEILENLDFKKEDFLNFHSKDIVYVKQNFHRISILLNKTINEIQSAYKEIYQLTEQELKEKQIEIETELSRISSENTKSNRLILDSFQDDLVKIDQRLDALKTAYEKKNANLTHVYQKDVTQINVNRQNEKEIYNAKLVALNYEFDEKMAQFKDDENKIIILKKDYDREYKTLLKEFKVIQNNFDRSLKLRGKRYYNDRYNLGIDYIKKQELYRSDRLIKDQKKVLYLKLNKNRYYYHEIYMAKLNQFFNREKDKKNAIIDSGMRIEAIPLDIQILLARHIHDLEINYLNLEQHYTISNHERKTNEANLQSNHDALLLKLERDRLNLTQKFEVQQNELDNYLNMEYEKNITEGKRLVLEAQKEQNKANIEIQLTSKNHTREIYVEKHNTEVEKLRSLLRITLEKLGLSEAYQKEAVIYDNESYKLINHRDIGILLAKDTIKKSELENTRAQKVLATYFDMLSRVQSELDRIAFTLKDTQQASDKTTFTETLKAITAMIIGQKDYRNQIMKEIVSNMSGKIQTKIDDLTLTKYEQEYTNLINKYEIDKKAIQDQKTALDDQIKQYRNQSSNLYQEIAIFENKNDLIYKNIDVVNNQIKTLKTNSENKQNRKTIKNLTLALTTHRKEILKNIQEIKHLRLQINQIDKRIAFSDKGHKPLENQLLDLEQKRKSDELILNENQYQEGKIYYDSLTQLDYYSKAYMAEIESFTSQAKQIMTKMGGKNISSHQFKKPYKRLTKLIRKQRQNNSNYHYSISQLLVKQLNSVKREQNSLIQSFHKNYEKSQSNLTTAHKNELHKILSNQDQLNKYQKSLIKLTDKRLKNSLDIIKVKHKSELKSAHQKHQEKIHLKKAIKEQANAILIASEENRKQVLNNQQLSLKKETKAFEIEKEKLLKDSLATLDSIRHTIYEQDNLYSHQLTQYAHHDHQYRSKLNTQLQTRNLNQEKTIDNLNKEIAQLKRDVIKNENRTDLKIERLVKKTNRMKKRIVEREKWALNRTIARSKVKFKQQLKHEKNTYV